MTVIYVDLSHADWDRVQGKFNWPAVLKATSPVLCLRVTYGDPKGFNPPSRHALDMARGAAQAGFDTIGGYHNLIKGDQASTNRQVDYLRRSLDDIGAVWAMVDAERYPELVANGLWPRWTDIRRFVDRWNAVDHRLLTGYLPKWFWEGNLGRPDLRVLDMALVASNYGSNPTGAPGAVYAKAGGDSGPGWAAYGGVNPSIWQYGSNIACPGASRTTDCNAYRGTLAQLRALLTKDDTMTPAQFLAILKDPTVAAQMRALPWQYVGGGIPTGMSTLGVLNNLYQTAHAAPTATEIAAAVVEALGGESPADAAAAIVAAIGKDKAAALAAALTAATQQTASAPG
ncbi:hypothetical protein ABZ671_16740 [Micromonospora sp. NPDC006766]|uniref:hypothetical protein n=1 Tax=Micromonospora sp. NPDC006766 TaxID=3154778 RepID=UPI00340FF512